MVTKKVSVAKAKAHFSELLSEVVYTRQPIVIAKHGKPVVAVITVDDLNRLRAAQPLSAKPLGALALVGALGDVPKKDIDRMVARIYRMRAQDKPRSVILEE